MPADTAPAPTFTVSAHYDRHNGTPMLVQAHAIVATKADADALAARFPKSCRMQSTILTRPVDGYLSCNGTERVGYVRFEANLSANRANGGRNETGIKRYRTFRRTAAKLGLPIQYDGRRNANTYRTEAELDADLA